MTIVLVVIGLILLLAGSGWFTGAATVGLILAIVGAIGILIQAVVMGSALKAFKDFKNDF